MFGKLLIANRGEIAVRVARACRDLGVEVVGVYSDADRDAPFLEWADEAYALGGTSAAESYLDIRKLMDVARRSGVDALHPGYGFLAENPDLPEACREAGITWVGPSATAIHQMGDKAVSRSLAGQAGVPLVPGTEPVESAEEVRRFSAEHGYPVAIKAVAGGGGRGLRVVHEEGEIPQALEAARREGALYFGNPTVYLERFLEDPKHVEIQLVGLPSGEVLTLGERDCSVQRRHQKLVEEAPGPTVTPKIRKSMEEAAAGLARTVGYEGAGTVEFLLAGEEFYFLEMNTRIQVEHPVTELVRGVDLVAMQLLVAAGEQVDAPGPIRGHAIECRINAESVAEGFRPAPGRITRLREPAGPGVRVDSAVREGYTIPAEYDSMVAKLVAWGENREQARLRMLRALREYHVEGVPTTVQAHQWVLGHPEFKSGVVGTAFLEREMPALLASLSTAESTAASENREDAGAREVTVEVNGRRFQVTVYGLGNSQETTQVRKPKLAASGASGRGGGDTLLSPIQGNVLRVVVSEGQQVSKGDLVCVVEAMKMENEIPAHKAGTVAKVLVSPTQAVATGTPLVEITA